MPASTSSSTNAKTKPGPSVTSAISTIAAPGNHSRATMPMTESKSAAPSNPADCRHARPSERDQRDDAGMNPVLDLLREFGPSRLSD